MKRRPVYGTLKRRNGFYYKEVADVERELRFQEMLKDLCVLARVNKNTVTNQLVEEFFEELQLSREQMGHIYAYLKEQKIRVISEEERKEIKDREEETAEKAGGAGTSKENSDFYARIEALCQEVLKGDRSKKQEILQAYQPKIREYIKEFTKSGILEEDLIQEAGLGLLLALESLAVKSEDVSFSQYLETGIENEIRRVLEEEFEAERADETLEKQVNRFHEKLVELKEELERRPTMEEICTFLKISKEEADYYFRLMGDRD